MDTRSPRRPRPTLRWALGWVFFKKIPSYTLAGFDLTTHSSSLLRGRRRPRHRGTLGCVFDSPLGANCGP
jgi:hypothetical protein